MIICTTQLSCGMKQSCCVTGVRISVSDIDVEIQLVVSRYKVDDSPCHVSGTKSCIFVVKHPELAFA